MRRGASGDIEYQLHRIRSILRRGVGIWRRPANTQAGPSPGGDQRFRKIFEASNDAIFLIDPRRDRILDANPKASAMLGYTHEELLALPVSAIHPNEVPQLLAFVESVVGTGYGWTADLTCTTKAGQVLPVELSASTIEFDGTTSVIALVRDVSERRRAADSLRQHAERLGILHEIDRAILAAQSPEEIARAALRHIRRLIPYKRASLLEFGDRTPEARVIDVDGTGPAQLGPGARLAARQMGMLDLLRKDEVYAVGDVDTQGHVSPIIELLRSQGFRSFFVVPLISSGELIGSLNVGSDAPYIFTNEHIGIARDLAQPLAVALEQARLRRALERRAEQLQVLRDIDLAISGSFDLRVVLNALMEKLIAQLHVDAADILLLNPVGQTLDYAAGRGFRSSALRHTRLAVGESYAGRALLEQRIVQVENLAESPGEFERSPLLANEKFISYFAVPVIAKGQAKGVLELFNRSLLHVDPEWLEFLEALAGQAAIAIADAESFARLHRANTDLTLAYESTLEGWSRALDLRDKETEGHTQRVADLTVRLARVMGMSEEDLVHIRRGALLHDIGKMGVPDGILLKPGPLTPEEWEIMRRHPGYAQAMLSPIAYLRPAIEIPHGHHEKWDGTGYPRGLKGEEIPLAARIFAVVDVWDALRSDRPYRPAWSEERTLIHIRDQAGTHFDPKVVEGFVAMITREDRG